MVGYIKFYNKTYILCIDSFLSKHYFE